jgi:hypothetical protein
VVEGCDVTHADAITRLFSPRPAEGAPAEVLNIFCPTGAGGGINPSCGSGGARGGTGGGGGVEAGSYRANAPTGPPAGTKEGAKAGGAPRSNRQLPPASREGAQKRFEDVAKAVFGKGGKVTEDGAIVYTMPGGRFVAVKLQATVVARHGSHVVLRYDARVDFGVEGRAATSVNPRLERESVAALRKVKEAAQAYHQAGFSLEVQPSDSRRREAYAKILSGMGMKMTQTGEVEVWNELAKSVANIFCPAGKEGE